ncbi:hypothetical protein ACYPKM_02990 [Pseudomonas aeruginosa]
MYQYALKNRAWWRAFWAVNLVITGISFIIFSFFPLIAKSAMPLIWVDMANNGGWNKNLQEIGMRLLANGRIELMPLWGSYLILTVGALLAWLGVHLYRSRKHERLFGELLTKRFWLSFYWWEKPEEKPVAKAKRPTRR